MRPQDLALPSEKKGRAIGGDSAQYVYDVVRRSIDV